VAGRRALLVVDVQRGFDDPELGPRDNPDAEANIAKLIAAWRRSGDPVVRQPVPTEESEYEHH
jgi:nicotinamidase-related amidase